MKKIMASVTLTDEQQATFPVQFKTEGGKFAAIETSEASVTSGDVQATIEEDPNFDPAGTPAQEGAKGYLLKVKSGSANTQGSVLFRFDGNTNPEIADFLEIEVVVANNPATAQGIQLGDPIIDLKA
jgi:hypothetical protein